jgi:hypothetical protein
MNEAKAERHVPPSPGTERETKPNGGNMELYTLLIAQSLGLPSTQEASNNERPSQPEVALPGIDFGLLADVRREQSEEARREQFVPGAAIRAAA